MDGRIGGLDLKIRRGMMLHPCKHHSAKTSLTDQNASLEKTCLLHVLPIYMSGLGFTKTLATYPEHHEKVPDSRPGRLHQSALAAKASLTYLYWKAMTYLFFGFLFYFFFFF
jgi:hypothetical protein